MEKVKLLFSKEDDSVFSFLVGYQTDKALLDVSWSQPIIKRHARTNGPKHFFLYPILEEFRRHHESVRSNKLSYNCNYIIHFLL